MLLSVFCYFIYFCLRSCHSFNSILQSFVAISSVSFKAVSRPCHLLELYPNRYSLKITFPMSGISTENLYVFPS